MRSSNLVRLLATLAISAVPLFAAAPGPVELEVLQADLERHDAMIKGDAPSLDKLLAAELTYITSAARIEDKQSILYGIRTRATTYQTIIVTERKARVNGNSAVVTGVAAQRGIDRDQPFDLTVRYTAVYAKGESGWQLTAFQATQLVPGGRVISGESA